MLHDVIASDKICQTALHLCLYIERKQMAKVWDQGYGNIVLGKWAFIATGFKNKAMHLILLIHFSHWL